MKAGEANTDEFRITNQEWTDDEILFPYESITANGIPPRGTKLYELTKDGRDDQRYDEILN